MLASHRRPRPSVARSHSSFATDAAPGYGDAALGQSHSWEGARSLGPRLTAAFLPTPSVGRLVPEDVPGS